MARTDNTRPIRMVREDRPYLGYAAMSGRRRKGAQRSAHKQDRQALRRALRIGGEPPRPQRRRVNWDLF
ncbi:hypothetical protein [Streptomyces sp. NRRL B-24484]|uniref:hypothetical protein n=1 Tax=Streptomyces sp. NRRL B-24484 TaxID=1463833 RepID=UPI0005BA0EFA|nr:hypothetical protein [Streptomyces sp. NRRL B-24484]